MGSKPGTTDPNPLVGVFVSLEDGSLAFLWATKKQCRAHGDRDLYILVTLNVDSMNLSFEGSLKDHRVFVRVLASESRSTWPL
jgi:hypothetical protein